MAGTGYSKRTLVQELGVKEGWVAVFLNAPDGYMAMLGELPSGVEIQENVRLDIDFVQLFATERDVLETEFPRVTNKLSRDGMLWISWPKKASRDGD